MKFFTAGERIQTQRKKAADVLVARSFFDVKPLSIFLNSELDSADMKSIEQRFENNLHQAGIPRSVYAENEVQCLIRAIEWVFASQLDFSYTPSGIPIFPRHNKELVAGTDKFKARTRMALCMLEAKGRPIAIEHYVGYLCDQWYSPVDGQRDTLLDAISRTFLKNL